MTLHLRRFGGGREVLALHCSLAHGGAWGGLAGHLPGIHVLAPDLPGHGRSPDWDGKADLHDLTTRACMALLPTGPIDLIGHSFGATVALRMALEVPERIRSLTLIEPVLFAAARAAGDPAWARHRRDMQLFADHLAAGDAAAAAAAFQAVWGEEPLANLPAPQRGYITARIPLIQAAAPTLDDDAAGMLGHGRLESLGLPVLLVEGAASPPVIAAIQTELARRLPQVTRAVVPGAGHMLPITHPAQVAALIAAHIA